MATITGKGIQALPLKEIKKQAELIEDIEEALGKSVATIGIDDTTATSKDILLNKTAYSQGELITGSMPYVSGRTIVPTTYDQNLVKDSYVEGQFIVEGDLNLKASNIVSGITIFGVTGNYNPGQLETAGYVVQQLAPEDTNLMWIDSANNNLLKVYNGAIQAWVPISAAFG